MSQTSEVFDFLPRISLDRSRRNTAVAEELVLALTVVVILVLEISMAMGGLGTVAKPLFTLVSLPVCLIAKRRSPWLYWSASMWFWLMTAFVRRIVEWRSGFDPVSLILVTPNLTALLMVPDVMNARGLFRRPGVGYALVLTACVLFGLFVSFFRGDVAGGMIAAADWLVPLLYLYFFIIHADRIDEAEPHIMVFLTCSMLLLVPYSLYQYLLMPAWDAAWMINSGMGAVGNPIPEGSKVFGPLNNPGFLAIWCGVGMVMMSHFRNKVLLCIAPFLVLLIAVSFVRAVYGSVLVALVVGSFLGRGGFGRLVVMMVAFGITAYVSTAILDPTVTDQISDRISTLGSLNSDGSAVVRAEIYAETPALIADHPFGAGIAGQGRGLAANAGRDVYNINVDAGPLSVLLGLGWIAGTLYILTMGVLTIRALVVARQTKSPAAAAMTAGAIVVLGTFIFLNVLGFEAVVLWSCLGFTLAVSINQDSAAAENSPASTRAGRMMPRRG